MENYDEVRQPHYLTRNVRTALPQQVIFFDTETTPLRNPANPGTEYHRFRLAVARSHRLAGGRPTRSREVQAKTPAELWGFILSCLNERRATYCFAHNLGFDLTISGFWQYLETGVFRLADDGWAMRKFLTPGRRGKRPWRGLLVAEDPPTIVSVRHGDATLTLVDTFNYWRVGLDQLGSEIGVPTLPMPDFAAPDREWFQYCTRDVEVIEKAILNLLGYWRKWDMGQWRNTAPGLAWNAYRHRFLNSQVLIHGHRAALKLERDGYYGGECRCFFVGTVHDQADALRAVKPRKGDHGPGQLVGPVYELDVASLYPSVMAANRFPCRLVEWWEKGNSRALAAVRPDRGILAEVELRTAGNTYPVRVKGRTRYAAGHFTTVLPGPELTRAIEADEVLSIGRVAIYQMADLFSDYVAHFWNLRRLAEGANRPAEAGFFKMMLNSLSGKWGQRINSWEDTPGEPAICPWQQWFRGTDARGVPQLWRSIGFHTQRSQKEGESPDSFPAVCAWITALGREVLRNLRQVAGQGNVCYQDTDSLHVLDAGYGRLQDAGLVRENELGFLRLKKRVGSAAYYGLKHYRLGDKVVIGAVARDAVSDDGRVYTYAQFQRLPSVLSDRPRGEITVKSVTKTLSPNHPDGTAGPDGWVLPVCIPEHAAGSAEVFGPPGICGQRK